MSLFSPSKIESGGKVDLDKQRTTAPAEEKSFQPLCLPEHLPEGGVLGSMAAPGDDNSFPVML